MTRPGFRARALRLAAASVAAFVLAVPVWLGVTLKAQSATEIWQVVFGIPTVYDSATGAQVTPTVPTPNPGFIFPSGVDVVPATDTSGQALPLAGDIVVADTWNNMVRAFDATTGAETLTIGSTTSNEFSQPSQVKVDANGRLLVSDTYHDVVKLYNADGTPYDLLTEPDGDPTNRLTGFDWPKGIAMTPGTAIGDPANTGKVAIISSGNFTKSPSVIDVQVFNSMLQPLFSFGGTADANGNGQLHAPLAVTIDPSTGDYLVTDTATNSTVAQVLVYDTTGTFLFSFTNPSSDPSGPMNFPIDITTEPSAGRVLVADAGTSVIYFFSVDYTTHTATEDFSISGNNTPTQFLSPGGLAFDPNGRLIVSTGTYDSTYSYPDPATQAVLVFDKPSLAIRSVDVTNNGVPVTGAVATGTTLTYTVTLASSSGTVSSVTVDGTLTDLSGTQVALGTQSPLGGDVTAGTDQTVTFTYQVPSGGPTSGTLSFSAQATGTVNSGTATSASVTTTSLPVTVSVSNADTTAPTITATPSPASPQASPWYNTPIQITLTASDNTGGSGVKEIDYYFLGQQAVVDHGTVYFPDRVTGSTAVATVDQDGTSTLYYRAVDNAGNVSAGLVNGYQTLSMQLDQTPPYVQQFQTPTPTGIQHIPDGNIRQWWNANVSISYTAQDVLSGLKSATPASPLTFTTEGVDQRQVVTLVDNAANSSALYNPQSYTSPAVSIDKTAPVLGTITRTPAANANGWNNGAVTVTFTASDALSGFPAADATTLIDGGLQASRGVTLSQQGQNQTVAAADVHGRGGQHVGISDLFVAHQHRHDGAGHHEHLVPERLGPDGDAEREQLVQRAAHREGDGDRQPVGLLGDRCDQRRRGQPGRPDDDDAQRRRESIGEPRALRPGRQQCLVVGLRHQCRHGGAGRHRHLGHQHLHRRYGGSQRQRLVQRAAQRRLRRDRRDVRLLRHRRDVAHSGRPDRPAHNRTGGRPPEPVGHAVVHGPSR